MAMSSMLFAPYNSHEDKMSLYFERFASQCKVYCMELTEQVNKVARTLTNAIVHSVGNSSNGCIETGKKLEKCWSQSVAEVRSLFRSTHKYDSNMNKTNVELQNQKQLNHVMSVDAKPCVVNIVIESFKKMAEINSGA